MVGRNLGGVAALHDRDRLTCADRIAEPLEETGDRAARAGGDDRLAARRGGNGRLRDDLRTESAGADRLDADLAHDLDHERIKGPLADTDGIHKNVRAVKALHDAFGHGRADFVHGAAKQDG